MSSLSSTRRSYVTASAPAHPYRQPVQLVTETRVRPFSSGHNLPVEAMPAAPGQAPRFPYRAPPALASRTITPLVAEGASTAASTRRPWLVGGFALAGAFLFSVPVVQAEAGRLFDH